MIVKPAKEIINELSTLEPNTLVGIQRLDAQSLNASKLRDVYHTARVLNIYRPNRMKKDSCIEEILGRLANWTQIGKKQDNEEALRTLFDGKRPTAKQALIYLTKIINEQRKEEDGKIIPYKRKSD